MGSDDGNDPVLIEEQEWDNEQRLEEEENPPIDFSYYYEITPASDYQESYSWNEMSFYHETTSWSDFEKSEWEIFEQQMENGIF